jgi:hypothetical protein
MTTQRRILLLSCAAGAALSGCDVVRSLTATTIVSGLVITTPAVMLSGTGGVHFAIPAETAATAWVGTRASATSTEDPAPVLGATVSLNDGSSTFTLAEQGMGAYADSSATDMKLSYQEAALYSFSASNTGDGGVHTGGVTAPPPLTNASITFSPDDPSVMGYPTGLVRTHAASTQLAVSWDPKYGAYAYVSLFIAGNSNPVWDNRPRTAADVLRLVAGDAPTTITIPADALSQSGIYAVVLVTMAKGGPTGSNTFAGSPFLAGSGAPTFLVVGNAKL